MVRSADAFALYSRVVLRNLSAWIPEGVLMRESTNLQGHFTTASWNSLAGKQ
jgi:hypothetical protein